MLEIACKCDKCGNGFKFRANCNRVLPSQDEIIPYAIQEGYVIGIDDGSILCKDCKPRITYGPGTLYAEDKVLGKLSNVKIIGG